MYFYTFGLLYNNSLKNSSTYVFEYQNVKSLSAVLKNNYNDVTFLVNCVTL